MRFRPQGYAVKVPKKLAHAAKEGPSRTIHTCLVQNWCTSTMPSAFGGTSVTRKVVQPRGRTLVLQGPEKKMPGHSWNAKNVRPSESWNKAFCARPSEDASSPTIDKRRLRGYNTRRAAESERSHFKRPCASRSRKAH